MPDRNVFFREGERGEEKEEGGRESDSAQEDNEM